MGRRGRCREERERDEERKWGKMNFRRKREDGARGEGEREGGRERMGYIGKEGEEKMIIEYTGLSGYQ